MTEMVLVKGESGKLEGIGQKGGKAWQSFVNWVASMNVGDTVRFEWHKPRSIGYHRRFFVLLNQLFDQQEAFDDELRLRQWLTVGAGYCDLMPGPGGMVVAIPQSIAFHRLDQDEFQALNAAVERFLWSDHAQRYLWPHLKPTQTYLTVDRLMMEFR